MRTAGIDLAVQPRDTAICTVTWSAGCAEVEWVDGGDDDAALAVIADDTIDIVGVDVPLGWPRGFGEAVAAHARHRGWPGAGEDFALSYAGLRLRRTDRRAQQIAAEHGVPSVRPMSVSADRLGAPAMRAAWLLARAGDGVEVDRSGVTGKVLEAYPAGAAKLWDLDLGRYKNRTRAATRAALEQGVATLRRAAGWHIELERDVRTEHELDALLCALVARAARVGSGPHARLTIGPAPADVDHAREEGWIHLPRPGTLPLLAALASA
jgi:predicted nuclease with RNAse H fold